MTMPSDVDLSGLSEIVDKWETPDEIIPDSDRWKSQWAHPENSLSQSRDPESAAYYGNPEVSIDEREQAFAEEYIANAMHIDKSVARVGRTKRWGQNQLTKPEVRAKISQYVMERHQAADEVLNTLHMQMLGDIGDFLDVNGCFDLQRARDKGVSRLIRKLRISETHIITPGVNEPLRRAVQYDIELYNSQAAAIELAKLYGLHQRARENEVDVERKAVLYERMIQQMIMDIEKAGKPVPERTTIIERIAKIDPDIYNYVLA